MRLNLTAVLFLNSILVQAIPTEYESGPRYETSLQYDQSHTTTLPLDSKLGELSNRVPEEHAIEKRVVGLVRAGAMLLKPVLKPALKAAAKKLKPVVKPALKAAANHVKKVVKPALKKVTKGVAKPVVKAAKKIISKIKPKKSTTNVKKSRPKPEKNRKAEPTPKRDAEPKKKTIPQSKSKPAPKLNPPPKKESPSNSKSDSKSTPKPGSKSKPKSTKPQSNSDIAATSKHDANSPKPLPSNTKPKSKPVPPKNAPPMPSKKKPAEKPAKDGSASKNTNGPGSIDLPSDQPLHNGPTAPVIPQDTGVGHTTEPSAVDSSLDSNQPPAKDANTPPDTFEPPQQLPSSFPSPPQQLPTPNADQPHDPRLSNPGSVLVDITNNAWISSRIANSFRTPRTWQKTGIQTPHSQNHPVPETNTQQQPAPDNTYVKDKYNMPGDSQAPADVLQDPEQLVPGSSGPQDVEIDPDVPVETTYDDPSSADPETSDDLVFPDDQSPDTMFPIAPGIDIDSQEYVG